MGFTIQKSSLIFFLQLFTGIFFFLLGLYGILPDVQESVFSLADFNLTLEVLFGVLELLSGAVLIMGLFIRSQKKLMSFVSFAIFIFWIARIVLTKFILGIDMNKNGFVFAGGIWNWLLILSVELMIMALILLINKRYNE